MITAATSPRPSKSATSRHQAPRIIWLRPTIKRGTTKTAEAKAVETYDELQAARNSKLFRTDPQRFLVQEYVKAYPIDSAEPFNRAERASVRRLYSLLNKDFDVTGINNKAVKKVIAEMYHATTQEFNASMQKTLRNATIPILYVNCDLWTSHVSGLKYIGVRVFYLDEKMNVKTHLLAIRGFRPPGAQTGDVVCKWVRQVLGQHGIRDEDIAGAVTDAGSDVRKGVSQAWPWEWCLPHALNRATIDGTGMTQAKEKSKNPLCRDLLELIKGIVGHCNKSAADKIALEEIIDEMSQGKGTTAKLSQAVAQRWISICKMLLRVLERWDALKKFYLDSDKEFPLRSRKKEVEEVYSIINAVKGVVVYSQTTYESTAQGGLQRLVVLATSTLEPMRPLTVTPVRAIGQKEDEVPAASTRSHTDLTKVAIATREAFGEAVAKRFVKGRYGSGLGTHSHRFDMAMFLCPAARGMKYIDTLEASTVGQKGGFQEPDKVKQVIRNQARDLLAKGIAFIREQEKKTPVVVEPEPRAKRLKTAGSVAVDPRQAEFAQEGVLDSSSDEDAEPASDHTNTPEQEADGILTKWRVFKFSKDDKKLSGVEYWRAHGNQWPSALRALAQAVFGAPSSAGIMERDFCIADLYQPRKRGSLGPVYLEMVTYLRGQFDNIPKDIPQMTEPELEAALPTRFTDKGMLDEVVVMDFVPEPAVIEEPTDGL